jgi:hypothetical protein
MTANPASKLPHKAWIWTWKTYGWKWAAIAMPVIPMQIAGKGLNEATYEGGSATESCPRMARFLLYWYWEAREPAASHLLNFLDSRPIPTKPANQNMT